MERKSFVFAFILLFSGVFEFRITQGLIEQRNYEIFEAYSENGEMFGDFEIFRRDKRNSDPTKRPGAETEQRPPRLPSINPRRAVSTSGPTPTSNAPTNATSVNRIVNDDHKYYKSNYEKSGANRRWYALDRGEVPAVIHERLSRNELYSDTIQTSFKYPYYGHLIDYVTITNKGYLFMGDVVHNLNASEQYVAPLMADFTTHNDTQITYVDTGDRFTAEWTNLTFQDKKELGQFSFQCSILKNGTLIFAYRHIPALVVELRSVSFPQRVGITDSFRYRVLRRGPFNIGGRIYAFIVQNYLVRYHAIDLPMENIISGSAYVITPVLNCVMLRSCDACMNTPTSFSCVWCPQLQRCSDGIDRHRQSWVTSGCLRNNQTTCPAPSTTSTTKQVIQATTQSPSDNSKTTNTMKLTVTDPTELPKDIASEGLTKETKPTSSISSSPTTQSAISSEKTTITKISSKTTSEVRKTESVVVSKTNRGEKSTLTPSTLSTKKDERNVAGDKPLNALGNQGARSSSGGSAVSSVGVIFIVLSLFILLAVLGWFVYAYRHPQTRSGRFLIEHRDPRKWFRNDDGTGGKVHYNTKRMELSEP